MKKDTIESLYQKFSEASEREGEQAQQKADKYYIKLQKMLWLNWVEMQEWLRNKQKFICTKNN